MLVDVLKAWEFAEVSAMDVYRDVFRFGEGFIQKTDGSSGKYIANPIGYWKNDKDKHGHFRVFFEDTFEETLKELQAADFAIVNGISYFGRRNLQAHASKMFAMIFDLDGVTDKTLNNFLHGSFAADAYPIPNYLIRILNKVYLDSYPEQYVVSGTRNPMDPQTFRNHFKRVASKLGIPARKVHSLRHTFATRCIESKCDFKTLSSLLGHADITTTLNLYVHPGLEQKRRCVEDMMNLL